MRERRGGAGHPTLAQAGSQLARSFFARSVHEVAPSLLGCTLLVDGVGGHIVEVEAYDRSDPASHSFGGRTLRNATMFGPPGHAYVYRSYGVHWCLNFVCGEEASGSAVLVRALEPTAELEVMAERRRLDDPRLLCAGPGRLCQALAVTGAHDGLAVDEPPFELGGQGAGAPEILRGPRIGISRATERPWRYGLAGSAFVSRAFSRRGA